MADIERINELVAEKDFENAKVLLDEALQESPDNVELLKLAGLTAVNLKNWPDAKKYFETVVKYQQDDATSWFYLASSYESLGDSISSKNAYTNVIKLRPEYMEAYQSLCVILLSPLGVSFSSNQVWSSPNKVYYTHICGIGRCQSSVFVAVCVQYVCGYTTCLSISQKQHPQRKLLIQLSQMYSYAT